ncbi:MAG: TetR family transcriptional regulator [Phycisphaerales bacterium]|nr:TetR family transcriptional regulator [Phycisphaerales bacterium]
MERAFAPPHPPPATSDARGTYDERLNHLLAAATEVIARDGYEKASMRAVAKTAGTSLAGMYHYFDSKERMLFLIQFRTFNALLAGLRERLHDVSDPVEQLRLMVRNHVGYFAANMAALKVCSHELDSLSGDAYAETRAIRRAYYELSRGIIERLCSKTPAAARDAHELTMTLFGMLNWLYRWYDPRKGKSPAVLSNLICSQMLHGIAGPSTAPLKPRREGARRTRTRSPARLGSPLASGKRA